ncbi:MAG: hypothetical protein JF628_07570 [Sphingomonas sp.]|nr:hypothetical protein [Sphingomonas sp.]
MQVEEYRGMGRNLLLLALAVFLPLSVAHGSAPAPAPSEIVIRGPIPPKEARALARKFTRSAASGMIARWTDWLCFSVQGLTQEQSAALLSRIERNAADVGVRTTHDTSCTWNVLIGFAGDADGFAAKLVKDHPGLLRDIDKLGLASYHERNVLVASRPIRWLPVERSVGSIGSGASIERASHIDDASHITTNVRGDKIAEIIIIDPQRVDGFSWQQLADYLTMVILTDPGMEDKFNDNRSVLSIFSARERGEQGPPELTSADRQILRGYYSSDPYLPSDVQIGVIADALRTRPEQVADHVDPAGRSPAKK